MNPKTPNIRLAVDPANPGQFLACCGLLELCDRLWPGAVGWFADGEFLLTCHGSLREALSLLVKQTPEAVTRLENGLEAPLLIAPLRISLDSKKHLFLNGWMRIRVHKRKVEVASNPPWNFWSGNQTSSGIWDYLREESVKQLSRSPDELRFDFFQQHIMLTGRFGFDPSPAWTKLDAGFSPNEHRMPVASSPVVELLAAVGLQRFRPVMTDKGDSFTYATWGQPLPPLIAAAAAAGRVPAEPSARFLGRVVSRGSYAALGFSTPL